MVGHGVKDEVLVPAELLEWAKTEAGFQLATKVRTKAAIQAVDFAETRSGRGVFALFADSHANLKKARALLEMCLQAQVKIAEVERQRDQVKRSLESTQQEFNEGLRVEFKVLCFMALSPDVALH